MRTARILLIGTAALIAALMVDFWAKWAALAIASLPLAFIIVGQFFLPRSRQSIRLWLNPELLKDFEELSLQLSGRKVTLDFFKRWHAFEIELHNLWLLMILALVSLGAMGIVWTLHELPIPSAYWYYGGSVWLLACSLAWRWLWERKVMRKSGVALGSFHVASVEGPLLKRVIYHFIDHDGGYRGGSLRTLFCNTDDDLTVIFYEEENPDHSVPASAMMFHRLNWSAPIGLRSTTSR
jgi:hypothetical protein